MTFLEVIIGGTHVLYSCDIYGNMEIVSADAEAIEMFS